MSAQKKPPSIKTRNGFLKITHFCVYFAAFTLSVFHITPASAQGGPLLPTNSPPPPPPGLVVSPDTNDSSLPETPSSILDFGGEDLEFEKSDEDLAQEARDNAFDAALQGLLPLRPEEIRKLLERFDRTQESVELPVYPAPKPEVTVETLSMDPGTVPKTIKVAYGYVSTLNIVDSSGSPWPIQNITWAGNFDVIEINAGEEGYSNVLRITPQSEFAYGNMSISLVDLKTPIIISLETSRDIVHYRFDGIIPERGPFAAQQIIQSAPTVTLAAGDVDLASVLEGVPPQSAVKMDVAGVDRRTSAYRFGGLTYLRTPLTLLSPGWISSASSADGMRVYALNSAPVVLLSDNGKTVRARLSDREDILNER